MTFMPTSSSSDFTAPLPRPYLNTVLVYNESISLNPLEVYINIMQLMSVLAKLDWDGYVTHGMALTDMTFTTQCSLSPKPDGSLLENDIAVIGLFQVANAIADRNVFYELDAGLFVDNVARGIIQFYPKPPGIELDFDFLGANYSNINLNATSGLLYDPKDKRFGITYTFDGVKIKSNDVFTSFLNAFAISAEHPNHLLGAYIPAAPSMTGDVIFSSWTLEGFESAKMSWARLKRALLIIWERIIIGDDGERPRFEGFEFGLEYNGVKIGAGRLLRLDGASIPTDATAIAR